MALVDDLAPGAPVSAIGSSMGTGTVLHAMTKGPDLLPAGVLSVAETSAKIRTRGRQAAAFLAQ